MDLKPKLVALVATAASPSQAVPPRKAQRQHPARPPRRRAPRQPVRRSTVTGSAGSPASRLSTRSRKPV